MSHGNCSERERRGSCCWSRCRDCREGRLPLEELYLVPDLAPLWCAVGLVSLVAAPLSPFTLAFGLSCLSVGAAEEVTYLARMHRMYSRRCSHCGHPHQD